MIVIFLIGSMLHHVATYNRSIGNSEENVKDLVTSQEAWYGILDDHHRREAVMHLFRTNAE